MLTHKFQGGSVLVHEHVLKDYLSFWCCARVTATRTHNYKKDHLFWFLLLGCKDLSHPRQDGGIVPIIVITQSIFILQQTLPWSSLVACIYDSSILVSIFLPTHKQYDAFKKVALFCCIVSSMKRRQEAAHSNTCPYLVWLFRSNLQILQVLCQAFRLCRASFCFCPCILPS